MLGKCLIWGTDANLFQREGSDVDSPRAGGKYRIGDRTAAMVGQLTPEERARLTTWLVDQRRLGDPNPLIGDAVVKQTKAARSLTYIQRRDRLLDGLLRRGWRFSDSLKVAGVNDELFKLSHELICVFCELHDDNDIGPLMRTFAEAGLFMEVTNGVYRLSANGFERLDELSQRGAETLRAFVAMWFSPEMEAVYADGIYPAIKAAGYTPIRIDKKEHNNKIDDEIIAELKSAHFVVADFTSGFIGEGSAKRIESRGRVYYESGFAQGLGTEVIWTVRADCIEYVHFDTRQFAHIVWDDASSLKSKLYNKIVATLGAAPGVAKLDAI